MKWQDIFRLGKKKETVSPKIITVEYVGKVAQKALLYTHYGTFMNFPTEGLVGILADQGNEESLLALPTDIEYRDALEDDAPLEEGEVAFGIPNKFGRIYFRNDNSITAKNENGSISLAEDGASTIKNEKGSISLDAEGVITTQNDNGSITLSPDGEIIITGAKDISVKSDANVNIEAGTDVNIKGTANINVEATANTTIKATGVLTLETGDAAPWKPNIFPACLFTGAPHSTIVKLKGA